MYYAAKFIVYLNKRGYEDLKVFLIQTPQFFKNIIVAEDIDKAIAEFHKQWPKDDIGKVELVYDDVIIASGQNNTS